MEKNIINVAYSVFTNKGVFSLLLGSGVSRSAGIPTGWEITQNLIRQISILKKAKISKTPEEWYRNEFNEEPDYSNLLEKLTSTQEERVNLIRPLIEPDSSELEEGLKIPTSAHKHIAELVKLGYIKVLITTNFDRLLENSLKDIGIEPVVISNPRQIENTIPLIHSKVTVIKINGDYLDTGFLNLKSELQKYDKNLEKLLIEVFENFGIISCGWSAKWDLALAEVLKSSNKFRFSNYFTHLGDAEPEIQDISKFRKGNLVQISDADHFFSELKENVMALEEDLIQHPLAPQLALARLKKYIVKEEYLISFHELISSTCNEVLVSIDEIEFKKPEWDTIREVKDLYLKKMGPLCPLLAEGVYWGKSHHIKTWIEIIKRLGDIDLENRRTGNYAVWSDIQYFPSLIARYITGLASVASGQYGFLSNVLEIDFYRMGRPAKILTSTNPWDVIKYDHLNEVLGQRFHTPMSEVLYKYSRPYFKNLISVDREFEQIFDYYEFICSLAYLKQSNNNERNWAPIGRYSYSDRGILRKKLEEAKNEKESFELIDSGLFSSFQEFETVFSELISFLKKQSHWLSAEYLYR